MCLGLVLQREAESDVCLGLVLQREVESGVCTVRLLLPEHQPNHSYGTTPKLCSNKPREAFILSNVKLDEQTYKSIKAKITHNLLRTQSIFKFDLEMYHLSDEGQGCVE